MLFRSEVVKLAILKKQIFEFFALEWPIKTSIPEEQPFPYFFGFMEVGFNIPQAEQEGVVNEWLAE